MQYGREIIWTDVPEITYDNVIEVVRKAVTAHEVISSDIDSLIKVDNGEQSLSRVKTYRSDIDSEVIDNIANEITEFWLSYFWANAGFFVQRGKNDIPTTDEQSAIPLLNEYYDAADHKRRTQENARFVEICGIGYTYIDINVDYDEEMGDSPFTRDVLDPRTTFIIRSSYYTDRRPMLGVTFRKVRDANGITHKYFTCFSKEQRFELNDETGDLAHGERSGEKNPLGQIPIVEWIRAYDRMGVFERQLSEMDNLNLLVSDITNDVEQNTQVLFWANDIEMPKRIVENSDGTQTEEVVKPQSGDWVFTYSPQDGKAPSIKPLSVDYDYDGMINNINYRRSLILQKCNVPQRNDNSGGSTGVAMSDATGWSQAEAAANKREKIIAGCMMDELKVVLAAIRECPHFDQSNPVLKLRYSDVEPRLPRQRSYELATKTNAIATLLSHGFSLEDCVQTVPLFDDPSQVISRSGEGVLKYQDTIYNDESEAQGGDGEEAPNAGRTLQDESDQIGNSPLIDGMKTDEVANVVS